MPVPYAYPDPASSKQTALGALAVFGKGGATPAQTLVSTGEAVNAAQVNLSGTFTSVASESGVQVNAGNKVRLTASLQLSFTGEAGSPDDGTLGFDFEVDGVQVFGGAGLANDIRTGAIGYIVSFSKEITGLSAGAHSFAFVLTSTIPASGSFVPAHQGILDVEVVNA